MSIDMTGARRGRIVARLTLAVLLASAVPLLVAAYGLYGAPPPFGGTGLLLAVAVACAVAGAIILWRLMSATPKAARSARTLPAPIEAAGAIPVEPKLQAKPGPEEERREVESLMDSLSRVLTTIEQQSAEINRYASRLDSAYREIETSSAQLKEFSFKDEVTGLYNRRFFSIRLEEEVSRFRRFDHPVSVVLLDLDRFKAVNDELGHAAGDETLRGFADILLKHSRGINVICRYGGDEFAVLLVETSKAGARRYADRIRDVLPSHRFTHGRRVTASFGIASLPEDVAPSPDQLIRAADEALYAAKRAGKNRVSLHGDIRTTRSSEGRTETE
jgi:diguanylate cyclase (GGDEF)-like protein